MRIITRIITRFLIYYLAFIEYVKIMDLISTHLNLQRKK